jgi:hypothetical protein
VPALPADEDDAEDLRDLLHRDPALRHLRVRKRASILTIESGPEDDPVRHARLRRLTLHKWTLEIATHMGQWQPTGERALMKELVAFLREKCPWVLHPVE